MGPFTIDPNRFDRETLFREPRDDADRATGRTFRTLLACIIAASEGEDVFFVGANVALASDHHKAVREMLDSYDQCMYASSAKQISILGGGTITFIGVDEYEERCRTGMPTHYYVDHYAVRQMAIKGPK